MRNSTSTTEMTHDTTNAEELLAAAGIATTRVEACPDGQCPWCWADRYAAAA